MFFVFLIQFKMILNVVLLMTKKKEKLVMF